MPEACPHCGVMLPRMQQLRDLNESLQADIVRKQSQLSALRSQQKRDPETDPLYPEALRVFEYWRRRLSPKAREFTGDRAKHVMARMRAGYSVADLQRAVDGCAVSEWYTSRGKVELEYICRNEQNLMRFLRAADVAERAKTKPTEGLIPAERLQVWQQAIDRPQILERLQELRDWKPDVVTSFGLGLDGDRITIPIHNSEGILVGMGRYQPNPKMRNGSPKMIASGARDLFPRPELIERGRSVWLVEGENDAIALSSIGQNAVGAPGINTWKLDWPERFERFKTVWIAFDCGPKSRQAAEHRQHSLQPYTQAVIVDLDPDREDDWDISNLIHEKGADGALAYLQKKTNPAAGESPPIEHEHRERDEQVFEHRLAELEASGLTVKRSGDNKAESQCPAHEDRNPSLSIARGDDLRVLLRCHGGCTAEDICQSMGWELRDLFP